MSDDPKIITPTPAETEKFGGIEVRTELTVLPADDPKARKIGFMVYESLEDGSQPDYDADVLGGTEEADKYRTHHVVSYKNPERLGWTVLEVLRELWGRPWDQYALNLVHSLRPTGIRVTNSGMTLDAQTWRVTVYLEEDDRTIAKIDQEVEVGCLGAKHGHGLGKYSRGESPKPAMGYFNPRGMKRLMVDRGKESGE